MISNKREIAINCVVNAHDYSSFVENLKAEKLKYAEVAESVGLDAGNFKEIVVVINDLKILAAASAVIIAWLRTRKYLGMTIKDENGERNYKGLKAKEIKELEEYFHSQNNRDEAER